MSVSAVSGNSAWYPKAGTATTSSSLQLDPSVQYTLKPQDPMSSYLTDDDRSKIKAATGVDIKPDGDMFFPMQDIGNVNSVTQAAGAIATQRAAGKTGVLQSSDLAALLQQNGLTGEPAKAVAWDGSSINLNTYL